jgi:hypothetical protein
MINIWVLCRSCTWVGKLDEAYLRKRPIVCIQCKGVPLELCEPPIEPLLSGKRPHSRSKMTNRTVPGTVAVSVLKRLAERGENGEKTNE